MARHPFNVKKEDSVTEKRPFDAGSDLRVATAGARTRAEEAALITLLPPVSRSSASVLQPVYGEVSASDPFTLNERSCESVIEKAQMLLADQRKKGLHPSGVRIGGTGQFSEDGLSILKKFCSVASTKWKQSTLALPVEVLSGRSGSNSRCSMASFSHHTNIEIRQEKHRCHLFCWSNRREIHL